MKTKIVIGSVLKPVDDIRHYHKIGRSLAENKHCEIHIGAYHSSSRPKEDNVHFYGLFRFSRLSAGRFLAVWTFFRFLLQIRPDVVIFCTHELIFPVVFYRLLFGAKLIYDVQESYFHNIFYSRTFIRPFNYVIGIYTRLKECILSPFVHSFWLAEEVYLKQLGFLHPDKTVLLENKPLKKEISNEEPKIEISDNPCVKLLICGTLAEEYGTKEAIEIVGELLKHKGDRLQVELVVLGYCPHAGFRKVLEMTVRNLNLVEGQISILDTPVPHVLIEEQMIRCDVVLMPYRFGKSTAGRVPTKLWESLALNVPFIIQENPELEQRFQSNPLYHSIKFRDQDASDQLLDVLVNHDWKSLKQSLPIHPEFWENEKMLTAFGRIAGL